MRRHERLDGAHADCRYVEPHVLLRLGNFDDGEAALRAELAALQSRALGAPADIRAAIERGRIAAKVAERELMLKDELRKAADKGDAEAYEQLEKQLVSNRKTLEAEKEAKKDKVRGGS